MHLTSDKRALKAEYDRRRALKKDEINKKQRDSYHSRMKDPNYKEHLRKVRKRRAVKHAEYCRRTEYKKTKKVYDRLFRIKKKWGVEGDWAECIMLVQDIHKEVVKQVPDKYHRSIMRGQIDRMIRKQYKRKGASKEYSGNLAQSLFESMRGSLNERAS